jgi:hypothetical protein
MKPETYQDLESVYPSVETDYDNAHLHDYVFHYNIFTRRWAAIPRECYQGYWSDMTHPGIVRSSSFETLVDLVKRISVDPQFLDKIQ